MAYSPIKVTRLPDRLMPDPGRVIIRYFQPGDTNRVAGIVRRIMSIPEDDVSYQLNKVMADFGNRHRNLADIFDEHYRAVCDQISTGGTPTRDRQLLIGAYFTMEYAIESAALFNPSMVPVPGWGAVAEGSTRFLMSLRATGEGHISSIVFRHGIIDAKCRVTVGVPSRYSRSLKVLENSEHQKKTYFLKLIEIGAYSDLADQVLDRLGEKFTLHELCDAIDRVRASLDVPTAIEETANNMLSLARSNYELIAPDDSDPSEFVIFPSSEQESQGIEDVRLVRFVDNDSVHYYGTYSAFNGFRVVPQLLELIPYETPAKAKVHTISGRFAQNKGLALFPRKIDGMYMMISRLDNENLYLMTSDNVRFWNEADLIQTPKFPWELVQIGNCGSPIETDAGWLLLTHGVGPMRQYCLGATLLDRNDPSKMIGQLADPLMVPTGAERTGYVPNVLYSCGGMIHNDMLIIPYAMSDSVTGFARVNLAELLTALAD